MISLKIQNLVLIEKAEITFSEGLNIITGETGSGKSVLLTAIRLIRGGRAEASQIRHGAEFAIVEAVMENQVHIRREIYRSGKNRCFIDDAQVSLGTLKEAVQIEMVDQNSSSLLFDEQKYMLDDFAGLESKRREIEAHLGEQKKLEAELTTLLQIPRERELEWAEKDLAFIEEVNFKEGEEEALNQEHNLLTHSHQLAGQVSGVIGALESVPQLKRAFSQLETAARTDPKLASVAESMKGAVLELEEASRVLESYFDRVEANPNRLEQLEARLGEIYALKKRFGTDIENQKLALIEKIASLETLDAQIEKTRLALHSLKEENQLEIEKLIEKRKEASGAFAALVLDELKSLNLQHAKFEVAVGDSINDVKLNFSANPGQSLQPLAACASGGELSRLLLAIKTLLSSGSKTIVFDEIDSNVGGQTALALGEKLKELGQKRQVICVTHFVQVAKFASTHFIVSKVVEGAKTYTKLSKLDEKEKQIEYDRMLGQTT